MFENKYVIITSIIYSYLLRFWLKIMLSQHKKLDGIIFSFFLFRIELKICIKILIKFKSYNAKSIWGWYILHIQDLLK